jgi:hypothetical protein
MRLHVKAALLSAFVLPGLGQLYKGERLKGGILIILVNIFLLAAIFLLIRELGPIIISVRETGAYDANEILAHLHTHSPAVKILLKAFGVLWIYGWLDAAMAKKRARDLPEKH